MNQLYLDIQERLFDQVGDDLKHCAVYNNQFAYMNRDQDVQESFALTACLVEFVNQNVPRSIGNGVQIYEPLVVRLHIGMEQLDSGTGTMNQNLDIFTLKNKFYLALQNWHTEGSGTFDRTGERQDFEHNNLYIWQMEFTTSYIDSIAIEPRGRIVKPPTTDLDLTGEILTEE